MPVRWRDERGSSTALLLISWGLLMVFVGACCDMALMYVRREQLRTALEAAVTAGAMQASYRLTVGLARERWEPERQENCYQRRDDKGNLMFDLNKQPIMDCDSWWEWRITPTLATERTGWEREVWTPHTWVQPGQKKKQLWEVFGGECEPEPQGAASAWSGGRTVCTGITVQNCWIEESSPGMALQIARNTYEANRSRWSGQMTDQAQEPSVTSGFQGQYFEVSMAADATMQTHFLRTIGISTLPIVPRTTDNGPNFRARLVRLSAVPPNCPT